MSPESAYDDDTLWESFQDGINRAQADSRLLLDYVNISEDEGNSLAQGILSGTASVVSDGSYKEDTPIGPAGSSSCIIAPSMTHDRSTYTQGSNWVPGLPEDQSSYRSGLAGVLAAFAILDVAICYYKIDSGTVTIALDGELAMEQCGGDWPLSVDQACFNLI